MSFVFKTHFMTTPYDILYERIIEMKNQKDRILFTASVCDIEKVEELIKHFEKAARLIRTLKSPKIVLIQEDYIKKQYENGSSIAQISSSLNVSRRCVNNILTFNSKFANNLVNNFN